ncbi:Iron-binding zinc finger CDGSH type [Candidatus Burarchaeum australiense]|nr:Iron-binding zinc finger CDGSH type [Candidatus Burarchaeum australiense]
MAKKKNSKVSKAAFKAAKVVITKNGPYVVSGNLPLVREIIAAGSDGIPVKWKKGANYPRQETYVLCRCGKSKNKPFCDHSHAELGFNGTETASKKKFLEQAGRLDGPGLFLADAKVFCAGADFCYGAGGVWKLTLDSGNPRSRKLAIQEACNCPSGRLVARDKKTGKSIEPKLKQAVSIVEDPVQKVSGPIWLKGGIPLESDSGRKYETRNRCTLCRCGYSTNKPFCDGTHISARFKDEKK